MIVILGSLIYDHLDSDTCKAYSLFWFGSILIDLCVKEFKLNDDLEV